MSVGLQARRRRTTPIIEGTALRGESVRIGESGTVLERVRTSQHTLSCVVGGRDKTALFVATVPTLDAEESGRLNGGRIECLQLTEE